MTMKYKKTDAVVYNPEVTLVPGINICGGGNLDTESSYDVLYTVSDQFRTVSFMDYVSTAIYLMHFLHGGKGVAFGQKSTIEDCVDFNFQSLFRKIATFLGIAKFRQSDRDRVVINDPDQSSPLMVDQTGNGTLYPVVLSNSPTFTGTPTAPTVAVGTNTTQLATTAFVNNAVPKAATTLFSTKVTAADVSTTYFYTMISDLANWNCIAVHFSVFNVTQNLIFFRPVAGGILISDSPSSGTYVRGGITVDWTNNRIGIRCTNGTDATKDFFNAVYGLY